MERIEDWANIKENTNQSSGSGSGSGSGYGSGYGYGDGDGDGYGYGEQFFILTYKNHKVFQIDETPTIITHIFGDYAKGFSVNIHDFTSTPCYIARNKEYGFYAHGKTFREAYQSLQEKIFNTMPVEERIEKFIEHFATDKTYKGSEFFEWHHILTGSCLFGRERFIKSRHLDLNTEYTVAQFIFLCEHEYGGEVITRLKKRYEETQCKLK